MDAIFISPKVSDASKELASNLNWLATSPTGYVAPEAVRAIQDKIDALRQDLMAAVDATA